ncbi:MAG: LytTR family transcriptional regulator DNA-binding domain-containing protein [Clostridiales bacterium]|nr:LytTR family transcriptional regulator DNA-binding domain-containing protein [Clostridiales bacterium]
MIRMLILNGKRGEAELITAEARRQAALLTDERWEIRWMTKWQETGTASPDIAYLDVTTREGLTAAERVRSLWKSVYMVLIISEELSPLLYLRPAIMAASVLLRPFQEVQAKESIREAIRYLPTGKEEEDEVFVIADREGKVRLPLRNILYFEARAKKIYAALETEEYGFYDSMEHVLERLPGFFCRCHRGYVINLRHVKRYQSSAGICVLDQDVEIPVSRSFRQNMKERFSDWKQE